MTSKKKRIKIIILEYNENINVCNFKFSDRTASSFLGNEHF